MLCVSCTTLAKKHYFTVKVRCTATQCSFVHTQPPNPVTKKSTHPTTGKRTSL